MFAIVKKIGNEKKIDGMFRDVDMCKSQLKQYALILNCPQKIIWLNDTHFKLLSINGDTKQFYVIDMDVSMEQKG